MVLQGHYYPLALRADLAVQAARGDGLPGRALAGADNTSRHLLVDLVDPSCVCGFVASDLLPGHFFFTFLFHSGLLPRSARVGLTYAV